MDKEQIEFNEQFLKDFRESIKFIEIKDENDNPIVMTNGKLISLRELENTK